MLSVPSKNVNFSKFDYLAGHYRKYNSIDLKRIFEKNNLAVIKIWHYGYPFTNIVEILRAYTFRSKDLPTDMKEDLSKVSFKTSTSLFFRLFSNDYFLFPLYLIQQFFKNMPLGSGILCLVQKIPVK